MRTVDALKPLTAGELLELWRYYRERVEDPLERTLLCNAAILRDSCYCQGEAIYGDELEVLRDLTPGEMEDLLLRLAEGEALPEERGGTFDLQRFADMKVFASRRAVTCPSASVSTPYHSPRGLSLHQFSRCVQPPPSAAS